MSAAIKCDRCGTYYQIDKFDISEPADSDRVAVAIKTIDKFDRTIRHYDLCRTCCKELKEWLSLLEKEKNND